MKMKITGTGSALPEKTVTNQDLTQWVDTSDEWIRERTGIEERRISTGETVASLAAQACEKALAQAGKTAAEVDLILLATCSPEYALPCCACQVQEQIGAVNAAAFDINAACSGFLFGLTMANAYIQTGMYRTILVIGSEVLSKFIDWTDRGTCILFGDGAGAVLAEASETEISEAEEQSPARPEPGLQDTAAKSIPAASRLLASVQGSDGSGGAALSCRERLVSNPLFREGEQQPEPAQNCEPQLPSAPAQQPAENFLVKMDGQAVYRFATRQVSACIKEVLQKADLSAGDIDLFVLHQANLRIIETVAKRVGAPMEKFPTNLQHYGNMSSATIPVLLDELNRSGRLVRGQKLVLSGFGAGLTYGASVLIW